MSIKRKVFGRAGASLAAIMLMAPMLAACGGTTAVNTVIPATVAPTAMLADATPTAMMAAETPTAMMAGETPTAMMSGATPSAMMAGMTPTAMMGGETPTAMMSGATPSAMMSGATPSAMMTPGSGTPGTSGAKIKVGLVTDVGKVNDGTFNQFAYDGLQRAKTELSIDSNYLETAASADYDKNLEQFASQNYDMVIAVGFLMGDALKANAAKHPNTKYAIVDYAYDPALPNVRGLVFAEDQAGYLAGALAASMSKSNVIGVVGGIEGVPAVKRYVLGYTNGAKSIKPDIQVKSIYIDSFSDRARGAEAAKDFMNQGADVIFGAGGQTGSGAIQAAAQAGAWVIGVDQDEYLTTFQNGAAAGSAKILSSATKRVDNAVFSAIKDAQAGTLQGGTQLYDAASQGVGLAPFHNADSAIPAEVKSKLDSILKGLADGSLKTGVTLP